MLTLIIDLILILNTFANCYMYSSMSIADKSYQRTKSYLFGDSYLDLRPKKKITLADERVCEICREKINVKREIPYNCTIPVGCPFSRKK
jgi:hypothetical protein